TPSFGPLSRVRASRRSSSAPTTPRWSLQPLGTWTPSPILTTLRSMLTPRGRLREPSQIGALAIVALAATLLLLFPLPPEDGLKPDPAAAASALSWTGLVGEGRPKVDLSRWWIVVLKAPSPAQRVAAAGGAASEEQERSWTKQAEDAQKRLLSRLALQGVRIGAAFPVTRG